jgi:hypothetical protein
VTDVSRKEEIDSRQEGRSYEEAEERQALDRRQEGGRDPETDDCEAEDRGEKDSAEEARSAQGDA